MNADAEIRALIPPGWRVNNLFQTNDGTWQANLRRPGEGVCSDFATAATPCGALRACVAKLGGAPAPAAVEDLL